MKCLLQRVFPIRAKPAGHAWAASAQDGDLEHKPRSKTNRNCKRQRESKPACRVIEPELAGRDLPRAQLHNWSTPFAASVRSRNSLQSASQAPRTATASLRHARESLFESHSAVTARLAPVLSVRAKPAGHAWNTTSRGLDQRGCRNKLSHRAEACKKKPFPRPVQPHLAQDSVR